MTATTLAERITRKASALVTSKPDASALAKAEAYLSEKREAADKARQALQAARDEAAATGNPSTHRAERLAVDETRADLEEAGKAYELAKANDEAARSSAEHARQIAALEKLLRPLYENGAAIDTWLESGGKLFAERQRLYNALLALVPDGRYSGALSTIGQADFFFREGLAAYQIPGGAVTLRDLANRRTCASVHREIGAAAMSVLKAKAKRAPGA